MGSVNTSLMHFTESVLMATAHFVPAPYHISLDTEKDPEDGHVPPSEAQNVVSPGNEAVIMLGVLDGDPNV